MKLTSRHHASRAFRHRILGQAAWMDPRVAALMLTIAFQKDRLPAHRVLALRVRLFFLRRIL